MPLHYHDEARFPHAPDVLERETADGGFSAGWGLHHPPAETYLLDCHTHMEAGSAASIRRCLDAYFARSGAMRLRRLVGLDGTPRSVPQFAKVSAKDDRFLWLVWPHHRKPDLKFLKRASRLKGFNGLKLHNHAIIREGDTPEVWRSKAWAEIFEFLGELGKPVLWHVTQRFTDCPYMGGGRHSYWKEGWPKGVKYGNRELLDVFLEQAARHRRTRFIGAHHLHIGPSFAGALFEAHPNLCVDFSCGNIVRCGDDMYEDDRRRWRDYVLRYPDRLLFGTDCALGSAKIWYLWETLAAHIRFLHQLHLPKAVLEKVAHENYERLSGLPVPELKASDWQAVRP